MLQLRFRSAFAVLPVFALFLSSAGAQQTPIALPYTMTTIAGSSPITPAPTAGVTQCPNLPAGVVSTDAFGDGCLAVNAIFGPAARGGVAVDAFGNVFVNDDVKAVLHVIDPTTGIMSVVAGGGTPCSAAQDSSGDGCLAATQTVLGSQGSRGVGIDPYGNVLLSGYSDNLSHLVCRTVSPLCTQAQIGYMELVVGCVATAGPTKSGTGGSTTAIGIDNVKAVEVGAGACTTVNGIADAPRGIAADQYGNIYLADTNTSRYRVVVGPLTSSYFSGNNPLYAALGVYYASVSQGFMYSIVNVNTTPSCYNTFTTACGGTATTLAQACANTTNSVTNTGSALDTFGDGCPLNFSSVNSISSSYVSGVAVDVAGNMVFTDQARGLHVFYVSGAGTAGAAMRNAIILNNPGVTPQPGFIYMLWGHTGSGTATALGAKPTLGTATAATDTTIFKVTVSPQGNIYIGDSAKLLEYDINTGTIRLLFSSSSNVAAGSFCSGSSGPKSLSAYSDGCPAAQSVFSNSNGLGVSLDGQNNLYLFDSASNANGMLVRKVLAQGFAPQTVGTAQVQTLEVHIPETVAGTVSGAAATVTTTPDITAGAVTCLAQNSDFSFDCTVPVTATPSAAGARSATMTVSVPFTPTSGTPATAVAEIGLGGTAVGSVLVVDSATTSNGTTTPIAPTKNSIFSGITAAGVALDGAGNVYAMDTHAGQFLESVQGAAGAVLAGTLPANASQVAVDQQGDVFAVGNGTSTITELAVSGAPASAGAPAAFTAGTVAYTPISGTAAPQAIAVDAAGNLFVADKQGTAAATAIYRVSLVANAVEHQVTVGTGFTDPVSLAVDPSGNVYVADTGSVYKLTPSLISGVPGYVQTTVSLPGIVAVAVATDAAGDLYVQDSASSSVIEVPVSGSQTTVLTGLGHPAGLAVDGKGNVYSADSNATSITQVVRDAVAYNFGTGSGGSPTFAGTLTNVGNQAITGSNTVTNTLNFSVVGGASNACAFSSSILGAQAAGNACTLTANFVGAGSGTVSDVVSYLPAASTIGNLTLTGTLTGTSVGTTTTISGPTPASPSFSAAGTEATFTVTVSPVSGTSPPLGTVAVTVDSTITNPSLVASGANGVATVTLTGLAAGSHTISAIYATSGGFTGSNSGAAQSFSIAQDVTTTTWTPGATSTQYSSPIGSATLNAVATFGGSQVAGVYVYTANGAEVNAGTYLAIGTYTLGVTFYPTDAIDFATSTASGGTFTVTKATTTAAVGATQMLVASDGSGNFTSVQAAVNALAAGSGSVYIKPGTYTGLVSVVQPNVALRGLGGDPTKVILTAQAGAFGGTGVNSYGGQYTAAQNNGSQLPTGSTVFTGDEASATLVVARGINTAAAATTLTPTNFYGENFTLVNTYDSDNVNTTTSYLPAANSGTCAVQSTPRTFFDLFNSSLLCAPQALAIWITSDQAVMNNVYTTSLQDTIFAGAISAGGANPARQYWFRGKVTGDIDFIFGDAAAVFDHTSIYTLYHGTATGTETVEAQNQADRTGGSPYYLSGYVMNSDVFTSQSSGMTNLYFGRPYGAYSTYAMLNSAIDQVNPLGYFEFSSGTNNLPTSTYVEYNDSPYTDPATGSPDLNGVPYLGTGGSTGQGVTGTRETTSGDPGTPEAANAIKTSLTQVQAQQYYPMAFLGATVPPSSFNTVTNWNPTAAIAANVNAFVPSGGSATVTGGSSVTLVMRPQVPGLGAVANGTYTIPTGTYTLSDNFNGSTTTLASGTLDASGEAYLTTNTLLAGTHRITMSYSGDSNFSASTMATPYILNVAAAGTTIPSLTIQPASNATYGAAAAVTVTVNPNGSSFVPTGQVTLSVDGGSGVTGTLTGTGAFTFSLTSLSAGSHSLFVLYGGDSNFSPTSQNSAMVVARSVLQVAANNFAIVAGSAIPAYTASITGFVNGDTDSVVTGAPSLTTNPASPTGVGLYPITASTGTLSASNYTFIFTNGTLAIQSATQAPAVATGDSRTVTEPVFPAVCSTLTAHLTSVNDDIPASVDATNSNPDGAAIQSALNSCANTNQAVRLSVDGMGHSAFLTGPLAMPTGVTLLVDPGVVVYFSRNAQDYDVVPGTHTCGTVNNATATNSCLPLINVTNVSNVGIMGFGKLDGRGGDTLLNPFPAYAGQSWWGLSSIANAGGSQQNPRFIQLSNASNVTLYKITLRNSPLFHVSGSANGFTAWDVKISTPTSSRNTDGIDPDQAQNFTITRSWISDGDDNVAVGSSGAPTNNTVNMSITNNHFFAGHGESIGSFTSAGVSNILFDNNMLSGNGTPGSGSSINNVSDSNSTGIRIKSANDRGGIVFNVQYSNSCFQYHPTEIQFTPLYNTNTGTLTPNFHSILLQNLSFLTPGTVGLTGSNNNGSIFPLGVTLDNVSFATLPASELTPAPANVNMTYGPGQVSSNFVTDFATYATINGNTLADNRTAASLLPPNCSFTYIAPELTGPAGLPQTVIAGQTATAVVILTPVVGGAAYPTGTVTLTDGASSTTTVTLPGTGDTLSIPLTGLSVGTHTFTATYSGDTNYVPTVSGTPYSTTAPYLITVNPGSLTSTTTTLSGVPATTSFGSPFTPAVNVVGNNPTGTLQFIVNGAVYATISVGSPMPSLNLPLGAYTISAVYSGDAVNAGSTSIASPLTVGPAMTSTLLSAGSTTTTLGVPVLFTANVSAAPGVGTPGGTVSFSYTTAGNSTPVAAATATLINGVASASIDLPIGTDSVTATYAASGSFSGSVSTPAIAITVNLPTIVPLPSNPIALPYTMTTLAGGSGLSIPSSGNMACAGAIDKYGDGCLGTAISFTAGDDMRAVVGDVFGNVYLSDISAGLVRRIAPNGVISNFAGKVSGTACVPGASTGCIPTLVSIAKPRGIGTDAAGNIYIADYSANKVFKVSVTTGLMYLVAGTGTAGSTGDGGQGSVATVDQPRGAWGDTVGNIYIADTAANNIRVVDATGNIHTFAGNGTAGSTGDAGPALSAEINNPQGVITDPNLNVYIADSSGGKIRVVCVTCGSNSPLDLLLAKFGITAPVNGDIYTIAGGATTNPASYPVLGTNVTMQPQKLAFDTGGNLYISDGLGIIWFLDFHTGNIRPIASNTTTLCAGTTDAVGDGCPATQASFGDGGNGIGVGADPLGNVYIADTANLRIRKVITGLASPSTATATTTTLPVQIHFAAGDSQAAANAYAFASSEWQLGTPACTTNADTTTDCLLSSSFTPAVPGARSTGLTVTSSAGKTSNLALTGTGLGAGATLDPASQSSFGSGLAIAGLAVDNAGNVYVSDTTSKKLLRFTPAAIAQGSSATGTSLTTLTAPGAAAVDTRGFVYVADTSTGLITQIAPTGGVSTLAKFTSPAGLAVDSVNNLYVSDSSTQSVSQISLITGSSHTLTVGQLVAPAGLAIDPSGYLLITDPGAGNLYRFNQQTGVTTTLTSPAVKPSGIATDAAGNLLIADTASIFAVPASATSSPFTVASVTPSALAIDAAGNLYTTANGSVLKLTRTQGRAQFASAASAPQTLSLLESGNQVLQLSSVSQSDATDYSLIATASTDCTLSGALPATTAAGGVCSLTATYTPTTYAATTDTATFNGNPSNAALSTPGSVQLILSGPTTAPISSIALGAFSPASPVFGQTVTVSATVSGVSVLPAGAVVFTIDGSTQSVNLSNGVATASLTGLSVGAHSVSAVYTSSNGYASSSTASASTVTVAMATQAINFTAPTSPVTFGIAPITLAATGGASGNPIVFSVLSGPGTISAGKLTVTGVGTVQIAANQAGNANYTAAAQVTQSVVVNKGTPAIALQPSANPAMLQSSLTLTATLSFAGGVPTGTVNFLDGTTPLGTGTVAGGVATLTTSTLTVGSHTITAVYSGDPNFATVTSTALTEVVGDFSLAVATSGVGTSLTVQPGGMGAFTFTLSPVGAPTLPAAVTLSASGLPAGATAIFSPATTVASGSGTTTVTMTIQVPQTSASAAPIRIQGKLMPIALALLLLPFAGGVRRGRKKLSRALSVLVLLVAAVTVTVGLSGCGSHSPPPQTYPLTVTGTSGTLTHSANVTLTVQ